MAKKSKNMMMEPMVKGFDDSEINEHEVHSAAQDLLRAEKHKGNAKLMKKVHKHLSDQKKQISSIQDLRDMRNESMTEEKPEAEEMEAAEEAPKKKK